MEGGLQLSAVQARESVKGQSSLSDGRCLLTWCKCMVMRGRLEGLANAYQRGSGEGRDSCKCNVRAKGAQQDNTQLVFIQESSEFCQLYLRDSRISFVRAMGKFVCSKAEIGRRQS